MGLVERNGMFWVEGLPLSAGTSSIELTATDAAGNVNTTNFTVVQSSVTVTMDSTPSGSDLYKPTGSVRGAVSDSGNAVIFLMLIPVLFCSLCNAANESIYWEWKTEAGLPINGLYAEVGVYSVSRADNSVVVLTLHHTGSASNSFELRQTRTNWYFGESFLKLKQPENETIRLRNPRGYFFKPLNGFPGKLRLSTTNGAPVAMFHAETINADTNYPASFRFSSLTNHFSKPSSQILTGGEGNWPDVLVGMKPHLKNFNLNEMFDIKGSGTYLLEFSPIIYRRSLTDPDLCERVDLPPVTISVRWE